MSLNEQLWIDRLNRIGIGYFRPLIMSILKNEKEEKERIRIFTKIERFIFINFRINSVMVNYGSSEFFNAARAFDRGEVNLDSIIDKMENRLSYTFNPDKTFRSVDLYNNLYKKFKSGSGYYGWHGLRYFLYEYENSLLNESRQQKIRWDDLLRTEKDKISIEHIYPQSETPEWLTSFHKINKEYRRYYSASLGNLLLLSMSINSSLQNNCFSDKKSAKFSSTGQKIRNGYSDGSHSEIEVFNNDTWGPDQIKQRGIKLLKFMESRWNFHFKNDEERERLLFLNPEDKR